jgi:hypothetical protein
VDAPPTEPSPPKKKPWGSNHKYRKAKTVTKALSTAAESASDEEETQPDDQAHFLTIFQTEAKNLHAPPSPKVRILVNQTPISGVADTGAQINVIPKRLAPPSLLRDLHRTEVRIKPYGTFSRPIQPLGAAIADVTWGGNTLAAKWFVVDDTPSRPMSPLVSFDTCIALGILTFHAHPRAVGIANALSQVCPPMLANGGFPIKKFGAALNGVGLLRGYEVRFHFITILGQWRARHATPRSTSKARLTLRYGRCCKTGSSPHIVGPHPG